MLKTPSVMRSLRCAGRQSSQDRSRRAARPCAGNTLMVGAAQAAAVDDAGVVQLVGDDDVVCGEEGGHRSGVGRETALEDDDRVGLLERREPPSSSTCRSIVPAIVRTEPDPTP